MIVECFNCESKVDAKLIARHTAEGLEMESNEPPFTVYLLECPACLQSLIAGQYTYNDGRPFEWSKLSRIWPLPDKLLSSDIPKSVKISLEEAIKCFKARAYNASVVMCGRSLEAICKNFGTKNKYLAGGIKELLEMGIIDKRLFTWSEALRKHRNIGAHSSDELISKEDSEDLLGFATAICEYVFVLTKKFDEFRARRTTNTRKK